MENREYGLYETDGSLGLVRQLWKYAILTIVCLTLMAVPCYLVGLVILSGE